MIEDSLKFKNNCIVCKKEFPSRYGYSKFCSNRCNQKDYRNRKLRKEGINYLYKCPECNIGFNKYSSLRKHRARAHKIPSEQTYIQFMLNNIVPTCKCGCGEKPKFLYEERGFCEYKTGHNSRVVNNWGHNPNFKEIKKKSAATQKKMFANGELVAWNKGLTKETSESIRIGTEKMNTPERARNLSKALTGVKKSPEHIKNTIKGLKKYWSDPKKREEKSHQRLLWMKENNHTVKSKTEEEFVKMIDIFDIKYNRQYYVRDIKGYFDFYIKDKNILIEVDGDFWHCNPITKYSKPKYTSQRKNLEKDKIKNEWCQKNNIKLLRFWENDIKNNRTQIIEQLIKELR